jgi:prepilin-type N-terminal cleavage/methylation domain-containing protein
MRNPSTGKLPKAFRRVWHSTLRRIRGQKGFTLVEIIVVISVVMILTGTVGVQVTNMNENTRLSNAASRAMADIRYAQELAMTQQREVDVFVTVGQNKYEIKWHDTGMPVPNPQSTQNLTVLFNQDDYTGVTMTSSGLGGNRLSFTPGGEPLIGGARFSNGRSVMLLNNKIYVSVYSSGYTCVEQTVGSGCTGC